MVSDNDLITFSMKLVDLAKLSGMCAVMELLCPAKYKLWKMEEIETELNDIINDAGLIEHV